MRTALILISTLFIFKISGAEPKTHRVLAYYNLQFVPKHITVNVGDTVEWLWVSAGHPIKSGKDGKHDGVFATSSSNREDFPAGTKFRVKFSKKILRKHPKKRNLYHYYCVPHWHHGMVGSVKVKR